MSSAPDTRPLADGLDPGQGVEDGDDDHNQFVEDGEDNVVDDASFQVISGPSLPTQLVPNRRFNQFVSI